MSRSYIIKECDDTIIEIMAGDGDVFIDDTIRDYQENHTTYHLQKLHTIHRHILYIKDQIQFAIIFHAILQILVRAVKPEKFEKFKLRTYQRFISKHQYFIQQLWYWVVYWNIWELIKFTASIALALVE